MSVVWHVSVSLDVLDKALFFSLRRLCGGWTDFTREIFTPEMSPWDGVIYRLHREDLGDLGSVELRKLGEGKTALEVRRPKRPPRREFTPKELEFMRLAPEERKSIESCEGEVKKLQKARDKRVSSVFQQIGAERKQQHQLLLKHHRLTIECLFDGLKVAGIESVVPTPQPSAGFSEDRPKWVPKKPATQARWRKAYELMCDLDSLYEEEYEDIRRENPNPKRADYVAYLASKMKWNPSEKTVGRIKQAGDRNWLE